MKLAVHNRCSDFDSYNHVYISGAATIPSFTAEVGHLNVPAYALNTGNMLESMALDFQRTGGAKATLKIMGQGEVINTTSQGGTPTTRLYKPFSQFNGSIMRNGVALANVTGAKLTYSNGLQSVPNKPAAEFDGTGAAVSPDEWSVAGYSRATAHQILTFGDGSPTFGGTPTDSSIVRLCQELKNRGFKVIFYPQLQIDTITPQAKPWRGHITPTATSDVTAFFTSSTGYNNFITHYANLVVGGTALKSVIDAFMLGSELVGLTNYMPTSGVFPAVTQLASLAATVKTAVGAGVKVTYGADWSEYHSVNGWYHLDALWSNSNIDVVGIVRRLGDGDAANELRRDWERK